MFLCNVYAFISVISSGLTMTVRVYINLLSSLCVRNHFYALIGYKHLGGQRDCRQQNALGSGGMPPRKF